MEQYQSLGSSRQMAEWMPQRIAILRALGGLGDFLCIVPALRALRSRYPHADIVLIGLPSIQPLCDRFPHYINRLLPLPGFPGLPEQPLSVEEIPAFLAAIHNQKFDLALQMHGSGIITNPLAMLLGAQTTAGFYLPDQYCPQSETFLPFDDHESEVRRYLRLLTRLGIPAQGEQLEFPVRVDDRQALQALTEAYSLRDDYVCVHPGASIAARRWSIEQFAQVADTLASRRFRIVLTGSQSEAELTQAVAQRMQAPALNLAGRTSLGVLAALLQKARLLICNDTGVSHLAAALRTPSVVIFTASDPDRWAPLDRDRHRVVCANPNTQIEQVMAQAQALLKEPAYVA